jgi:hypothetical protein
MLVGAEGAGLLEQAVHERRLAVVHVRDDGDVSNVLHNFETEPDRMPFWGKRSSRVWQ